MDLPLACRKGSLGHLGPERKKVLRDEKLFRIVLRKPVDPRELLEEVRAATAGGSGSR